MNHYAKFVRNIEPSDETYDPMVPKVLVSNYEGNVKSVITLAEYKAYAAGEGLPPAVANVAADKEAAIAKDEAQAKANADKLAADAKAEADAEAKLAADKAQEQADAKAEADAAAKVKADKWAY